MADSQQPRSSFRSVVAVGLAGVAGVVLAFFLARQGTSVTPSEGNVKTAVGPNVDGVCQIQSPWKVRELLAQMPAGPGRQRVEEHLRKLEAGLKERDAALARGPNWEVSGMREIDAGAIKELRVTVVHRALSVEDAVEVADRLTRDHSAISSFYSRHLGTDGGVITLVFVPKGMREEKALATNKAFGLSCIPGRHFANGARWAHVEGRAI